MESESCRAERNSAPSYPLYLFLPPPLRAPTLLGRARRADHAVENARRLIAYHTETSAMLASQEFGPISEVRTCPMMRTPTTDKGAESVKV
jgi:hypothetical protein